MKKLLFVAVLATTVACNNSKKEKNVDNQDVQSTTTPENNTLPANTAPGGAMVSYSVADTVKNVAGSVLVQKDKDKLSPGNEYLAVVTANGPGGESFVINFLFALKPGIYPVVGLSLSRDKQVFGGILGGKPRITKYNVNLTECADLGSNGMGGHKWKLSGSVDEEVTIDAMGIMKMDKTHPENINVNKISFTGLTFDDNWEQLLEEGMKKFKESQ